MMSTHTAQTEKLPNEGEHVYIAHNACINASYDVNLLRESLRRAGVKLVADAQAADHVVYAGCSVRQIWVDDAIEQAGAAVSLAAPGTRLTFTGCAAATSGEEIRSKIPNVHFRTLGELAAQYRGESLAEVDATYPQNGETRFEATETSLAALRHRVGPVKADLLARLQQVDREYGTDCEARMRRTTKGFVFYNERQAVEIIAVARSCQFSCSFCSIPRGRGPYTSVPLDAILAKVRHAVHRGVYRILLVGDEVGNYGTDGDAHRLSDLLEAVLAVDGRVKVLIRYIEPKPALRYRDQLLRLCREGRIELLYIPLQSGSQRVVAEMNRGYDLKVISALLEELAATGVVLYGNWMVGFPGETEADVAQTQALIRHLAYDINVAIPFSARPGTPASRAAQQVSEAAKERRIRQVNQTIAAVRQDKVAAWLPMQLEAGRRDAILALAKHAAIEDCGDPGIETRDDARPLLTANMLHGRNDVSEPEAPPLPPQGRSPLRLAEREWTSPSRPPA